MGKYVTHYFEDVVGFGQLHRDPLVPDRVQRLLLNARREFALAADPNLAERVAEPCRTQMGLAGQTGLQPRKEIRL